MSPDHPSFDHPSPDTLAPSPLDTWPPSWTPAAVVFDCDGVLVDTEAVWVRVQDRFLARHDAALDEGTRRDLTGRSGQDVLAVLARTTGMDPEEVGRELLRDAAGIEDARRPLPGALETLRAIAAVRPVAVASNSPRAMLDEKLAALGLTDVVDASIAIEDVLAPKPAPDMYLAAARALGADPAETLGFEDSETGAQAARDAGLQLIVVPSVAGQDPAAPRRVDSLEDPVLAGWIAGWERDR